MSWARTANLLSQLKSGAAMISCRIELGPEVIVPRDADQLRVLLRGLESAPDPNATIYAAGGNHLLVSARDGQALIVYHDASLEPPYLSASLGPASDDVFAFLVGDTPTPVPRDRCIPQAVMEEVVLEFVQTAKRSKRVTWIED